MQQQFFVSVVGQGSQKFVSEERDSSQNCFMEGSYREAYKAVLERRNPSKRHPFAQTDPLAGLWLAAATAVMMREQK